MNTKKTSLAVGLSSAILLAVGNTLPAFADSSYTLPGNLASARFQSAGDIFYVNDTASDGRGAYVEFYIPATGRRGICSDTDGATSAPTTCNLNFREGLVIHWRLSAIDANGVKPPVYGPWIHDRT